MLSRNGPSILATRQSSITGLGSAAILNWRGSSPASRSARRRSHQSGSTSGTFLTNEKEREEQGDSIPKARWQSTRSRLGRSIRRRRRRRVDLFEHCSLISSVIEDESREGRQGWHMAVGRIESRKEYGKESRGCG